MDYKKQLTKSIASLALLIALMLPTAVQFIHMFEGHEHIACSENKTHIHKSSTKCEICSFHLGSFNYDITEYPDLLVSEIPMNVKDTSTSLLFHSFKVTNTQLRAPPVLA